MGVSDMALECCSGGELFDQIRRVFFRSEEMFPTVSLMYYGFLLRIIISISRFVMCPFHV